MIETQNAKRSFPNNVIDIKSNYISQPVGLGEFNIKESRDSEV